MSTTRKGKSFSDDEKALVTYLKEKLNESGVHKFPQDWHLKQLSTARRMLSGQNPPRVDDWKACIDWAFSNPYWQDKVDHLARILSLWPKFKLQKDGDTGEKHSRGHHTTIQRGSLLKQFTECPNKGDLPF